MAFSSNAVQNARGPLWPHSHLGQRGKKSILRLVGLQNDTTIGAVIHMTLDSLPLLQPQFPEYRKLLPYVLAVLTSPLLENHDETSPSLETSGS